MSSLEERLRAKLDQLKNGFGKRNPDLRKIDKRTF